MSDSAYSEFVAHSPEEGFEWLRKSLAHAELLRKQLGAQGFAEYEALAQASATLSHLSVSHPKNLLFLPGIMGSSLGSETLGGIWWLDLTNRDRINDLRLSPDGTKDADPDFCVGALTTDHRYSGFLSAALKRDDFGHDRHPYDWRKALELSAVGLRDKIKAIYRDNGGLKVHLVAHSMGGLLVRTSLMRYGEELWPLVGKIAFIGTPHYGSPAIAGYLKSHFWGREALVVLGLYLDRATFRSLRGALNLLPAPAGVYPGSTAQGDHPCANFDLYDAGAWRLGLSPNESDDLQAALDDTATFHRELHAWHCGLPHEKRDLMCAIVGTGFRTLFRLEFRSYLGLWKTKKIVAIEEENPHRMGDGRVPCASAALENIGETRYVGGVHGGLPNMPAVYQEVFRWLNGEPLQLPKTPKGASVRHLGAVDELTSRIPALDGSSAATDTDPGYLQSEPDRAAIAAMQQQVEEGVCPEFLSVSLL